MSRYVITEFGVVIDTSGLETGEGLRELSNGEFVPAFTKISLEDFWNARSLPEEELRSYIEKSVRCQRDDSPVK